MKFCSIASSRNPKALYGLLVLLLVNLSSVTSLHASSKSPDPMALKLGYKSQYINANNLNFHYVERGEGEVILFLHGYPFFWYGWHNLLERFSITHRVIAPDNRGYNLSDKPKSPDEYHLPHLVADVAAQIKQLSPGKKVILVGHDWGGTLAWSIAKKHPELLHKVVVINAPPYNVLLDMLQYHPVQRKASAYMEILKSGKVEQAFRQQGPAILWNYGFNRRYENGELTDADKEEYFKAWRQPEAMSGALNWYRANIPVVDEISKQHYWPAKNSKVNVPSLLIWTEGEKVFVPEVKTETQKIAPDLTVVTLEGSGHAPFMDKPDAVAEVMTAFFNKDSETIKQFDVTSQN